MPPKKATSARRYRYSVLFNRDEDGAYVALFPSLPGLVTEGDTLQRARERAGEAIRGHLERLAEDGLPLPRERYPMREQIEVVME